MQQAIASLRSNVMPTDFNHSTLYVVNHVITVYFGPEVSKILSLLAMHNISFRYTQECFPGLIAKLSDPGATIMVFVSGRAVLVGSKSEVEALFVAQWMRNEFELFRQQYAPHLSPRDIMFANPHTRNIVNSSSLPPEICPVNLGLYKSHHPGDDVIYSPSTFSGCTIERETDEYKAVIVIFEGGNFNIMGCVKQETAIECAQYIVETMKNYPAPKRKCRIGIVQQRYAELEAAQAEAAAKLQAKIEPETVKSALKLEDVGIKLGLTEVLDPGEQETFEKLMAAGAVITLT